MPRTVHVFVLGDLARSPRILSHARFLAKEGWRVTVSGFLSSPESCTDAEPFNVLPISPSPDFRKFIYPSILALLLKFLFTTVMLICHILRHCRSDILLLQNPPSVPTLLLLHLFAVSLRKKLIVDWHNYGFTLLELGTSPSSTSSRIYKLLELEFAGYFMNSKGSDSRFAHLCVSRAMQQDLETKGISATVFYDRPPEAFHATSAGTAHALFTRLATEYPQFGDPAGSLRRTRLTEITALPAALGGSTPQWRLDRPALVVSSCSWTADDDFGIILDALDLYNTKAASPDSSLPKLLFVVTGRGPLKDYYSTLIEQKRWSHVEVIMPWLVWEDYPVLLGCADLGISVHRSSSNLDLPMKVVDLFGVGVPVLALHYPTLSELMPKGQFGQFFSNATDLSEQLIGLLRTNPPQGNFGDRPSIGSAELQSYRNNLKEYNKITPRAYAYWRTVVLPIFERMVKS